MSQQSLFSVNKVISLFLIGSQIAAASPCFANPTSSVTPEASFVAQAIALQGAKLSQTEMQNQVVQTVKTYLAAAPAQGQTERLEQALVDTGIYTSAQADSFVADSALANAKAGENPTQDQINNVITQLVSNHPAGAQFSNTECDVAHTGSVVGFLGGFVMLSLGLVLGHGNCVNPGVYNPQQYGSVPECGTPAGDAASHNGAVLGWEVAGGGAALMAVAIISTVIAQTPDCRW